MSLKKIIAFLGVMVMVVGFAAVTAAQPETGSEEAAAEEQLIVCTACGELRGTANCCLPDAEKCSACGLNKGSIGCCKDLQPAEGAADIVLCPGCGLVKGSADCCNPDAPRCVGCGSIKGSPGCCKLSKE